MKLENVNRVKYNGVSRERLKIYKKAMDILNASEA